VENSSGRINLIN